MPRGRSRSTSFAYGRLLEGISGDLLTAVGPSDVAARVYHRLARPLALDAYFNFLVDREAHDLLLVAHAGVSGQLIADVTRLPIGAGVCGLVAREGRPVVVSDVRRSGNARLTRLRRLGFDSYACFPLQGREGLVGTLSFGRKQPPAFSRLELELLRSVSSLVALAIEGITERTRAAESLRDADRCKDEFLATLAHELRNPLAPIRFALTLLAQPPGDTASIRARQVIERQVAYLVRLVDDLLDVSRITRGKIQLRREPVRLADVMRAAVESAGPSATAARHALDLREPAADVLIDGDPARLVQVFTNLLNNAVKFTPPGGRITFETLSRHDTVDVRVADTGQGIDPAILPHLFEMFHQGPAAASGSQGGLGIGLALARRLVDMHGGSIRAASEGRGRGAEFLVTLPRLAAVLPAASTQIPPPVERGETRLSVLAIDDNVDAAAMLGTIVETLGHDAETAHDGVAALRLAEASPPDVALVDIGLPGMSGYELAERFRASPRLRDAYLVAITGWGQAEDRRRAREAGFDWHLTKPADPAALRALLATIAEGRTGRAVRVPQTRRGDAP